jgi:hypothetical protein
VVVQPAIDAFQRPSSQRLLHYWPPSSFHLFPVCSEHPGVSLPVLFNALGVACGACGLGYPHPHQVWWDPPMYMYIA